VDVDGRACSGLHPLNLLAIETLGRDEGGVMILRVGVGIALDV
jgi:hypothetical protein